MLNELASEIRKNNEKNGFIWNVEKDVPTCLCLIHSEVSEALESYRDDKLFGEELADILIRTLDLADRLNVNIDKEVQDKIEKNRLRGYRHGRKRF